MKEKFLNFLVKHALLITYIFGFFMYVTVFLAFACLQFGYMWILVLMTINFILFCVFTTFFVLMSLRIEDII